MKRQYVEPVAEAIFFNYEDVITASSGVGHFDSNGKWHSGGNGNKHVGGVNYEGASHGNGVH